MTTRVLYIDPQSAPQLASLPYEELGRVDDGVWVSCPDDTVRAVSERRPPLFLYFDQGSYGHAVAELSATQIQAVIRRRRERWTPEALAHSMQRLYEVESARLEGLLRARALQPGSAASGDVDRSLALLRKLSGLERYMMVPAKAMAVTVLEGESLLVAVLQSALASGLFEGKSDRSILAMHLERRKLWAQAVSQVAAALGAPDLGGVVYADASRGIFLHPADEAFERALSKGGEQAVRWRDGLVFTSAERHLPELREGGRSVDILYEDPGEFYDSAETLTEPQLFRDLTARLQRSPEEIRQHRLRQIDRLHLHQVLIKLELRNRPDAAQACDAAAFDRVLQEESALLGRSLISSRTFSARQEFGADAQPLAIARDAGSAFAAELALFTSLASRYAPSYAGPLNEVQKLRQNGANG
jgi:hypothetical protein